MEFEAEYGVAFTFGAPIKTVGSNDFATSGNWTPASGDVKISKDFGAVANMATLPTAISGVGSALWKWELSATEMQASKIVIQVVDSASKAVDDQAFIVTTYGNSSAQHLVNRNGQITTTVSGYTPGALSQIVASGDAAEWNQYSDATLANQTTIISNIATTSGNVTAIDSTLDTVSGNIATVSSTLNTVSGNLTTTSNTIDTVSGNIAALNDPTAATIASTVVTSGNAEGWVGSGNVTVSGHTPGALSQIVASGDAATAGTGWGATSAGGLTSGIVQYISDQSDTIIITSGNANWTTADVSALALQSTLVSASGNITTASSTIDAVSGNLTTVGNTIDVVSGNLTTVSGNLTTIGNTVDTVSGNVTTVSSDIAGMSGQIGEPVALDGGAATVGGMLTKIADDNGGSDFDATTDSLAEINTAIVAGTPLSSTVTSGIAPTGTVDSGTWASTLLDDGTYWQISPAAGGLNVWVSGSFAAGRKIDTIHVNGRFDAGPNRYVNIYAYNWTTSAYDLVTDTDTRMNNASSDNDYTVSLLQSHASASGDYMFEFRSPSTTTGDDLYLDEIVIDSVAGLTTEEITSAVWSHHIHNYHDDVESAGHLLHMGAGTDHGTLTSVTDQTTVSISGIVTYDGLADDFYKYNNIMFYHVTSGLYHISTIMTSDAWGTITLDEAPPFTLDTDTHALILPRKAQILDIRPPALSQIASSGNAEGWNDTTEDAISGNLATLTNYVTTISGKMDDLHKLHTFSSKVDISGVMHVYSGNTPGGTPLVSVQLYDPNDLAPAIESGVIAGRDKVTF
jgi:hypothetical protein